MDGLRDSSCTIEVCVSLAYFLDGALTCISALMIFFGWSPYLYLNTDDLKPL